MKRAISRIQRRIEDLEAFDPTSIIKRWAPEVEALQVAIKETLAAVFGHETVEYKRYRRAMDLDRGPIIVGGPLPLPQVRQYVAQGKEEAIILLRQAIRGLQEEILETEEATASEVAVTVMSAQGHSKSQIFIGHGHSFVWHQLKSFLGDRLHLTCNEFNSEAVAGKTTTARLQDLLDDAAFAFLVMTAEDTHADSSTHARENVIHEAGLFQGRLGFERAIILLEDGCAQFSNIHGLSYIRFPKGNLEPAFEQVRQVLEREQVL